MLTKLAILVNKEKVLRIAQTSHIGVKSTGRRQLPYEVLTGYHTNRQTSPVQADNNPIPRMFVMVLTSKIEAIEKFHESLGKDSKFRKNKERRK